MNHHLRSLGWSDFFEGARRQAARPDLHPVRVIADHGALLVVDGAFGRVPARAAPGMSPVAVGDWVLGVPPAGDERARLELPLVRRTELVRDAAGRRTARQTVAANLDVVFIVTSPDDLNPRRHERYLADEHGGGAEPVVIVNKADLGRPDVALPGDVPVLYTSAADGHGVDALRARLGPSRTGGFVGMSGVGKSSLVNALLGREAFATGEVRGSDLRGKHTTTHRELVLLPDDGGVLIDTPGMRELGLWDDAGLASTFEDVEALAVGCRFRDCTHGDEPGCALRDAVERGELDVGRLENWLGLQRELARTAARRDAAQLKRDRKRFGRMVKEAKRDRDRRRR